MTFLLRHREERSDAANRTDIVTLTRYDLSISLLQPHYFTACSDACAHLRSLGMTPHKCHSEEQSDEESITIAI